METVVAVILASCALLVSNPSEITRGPYLQLAHARGITVVWRASREHAQPRVKYWLDGEEASLNVTKQVLVRKATGPNALSQVPDGEVQYEATISRLKPSTSYRYAIYDGERLVTSKNTELTFATHPEIGADKPARIWVVGDSGTGEQHQRDVHLAMRMFTKKEPIDFYLHVGDMAYGKGTDKQFQERFFGPYQRTLQEKVCWASMGNHEGFSSSGKTGVGPYYDAYVSPKKGEAGGVPSGTEAYYSFDYGNIHAICLNSHDVDRRPQGRMAKWLIKDLAQTKAKWIVGFWHHPPYTKGTHDSDTEKQLVEMRQYIMPIMENGGVDLVLSGHSHIYERSMLIDGAYQTPTTAKGVVLDDGDGNPDGDGPYRKSGKVTPHNGTVAIVTGHGGALGKNSKGVIPLMQRIVLDHGSTILDIDGDTLTGVMLDLNGKQRDRFQILKKGIVLQSIIKNPKIATRATEERTGHGVLGSPKTKRDAAAARKAGEKNLAQMVPVNVTHLIPPNATWSYLAGGQLPETELWTLPGFDAEQEEAWSSGVAGFGYGDNDDRTVLKGMKDNYTQVFIRREFQIPVGTDMRRIGLVINYDDGFALFLNGEQVLSKSLKRLKDGKVKVSSHEAAGPEYFPLANFAEHLKEGRNVIAIEAHNCKLSSTDFTIDPYLVIANDSEKK
jgi:hypothetical protein